MSFCKEQEICKPFECRKADCPIGEELRKLATPKTCGESCRWTTQGINGINACKNISCPKENIIIEFRKNNIRKAPSYLL
jgi:hypothetical protein